MVHFYTDSLLIVQLLRLECWVSGIKMNLSAGWILRVPGRPTRPPPPAAPGIARTHVVIICMEAMSHFILQTDTLYKLHVPCVPVIKTELSIDSNSSLNRKRMVSSCKIPTKTNNTHVHKKNNN